MHGYTVILYDIAPEALQTAGIQIKAFAASLVSQNRMTQDEAESAFARIRFTSNPEDAAGADW